MLKKFIGIIPYLNKEKNRSMFKIITAKKQREIDEMMIKKLKFVAIATLENYRLKDTVGPEEVEYNQEIRGRVMRSAEAVFYADDVILYEK